MATKTHTHWLQYKDTICQAAFSHDGRGIRVVALIGASQYIDRTMGVKEARVKYRELVRYGWTPVVPSKTTPISVYNIRQNIHD